MKEKKIYTKEFKEQAVAKALSSKSISAAAREMGILQQTLDRWVRESKKNKPKKSNRSYTEEFKESAVNKVKAGASLASVARETGVTSQVLQYWVNKDKLVPRDSSQETKDTDKLESKLNAIIYSAVGCLVSSISLLVLFLAWAFGGLHI